MIVDTFQNINNDSFKLNAGTGLRLLVIKMKVQTSELTMQLVRKTSQVFTSVLANLFKR